MATLLSSVLKHTYMEEEQGFELEESEQEIDILSDASEGCRLSEDSGGDPGFDLTLGCADGFSPTAQWEDAAAGFTFEADCCPSQTGSTNSSSSVNWPPGVDTGSLIAMSVAPVTPQGQALMANVYLSMKKLERSVLKSICAALGKPIPPAEPSEMACGFEAWQPTHSDGEGFQLDDSCPGSQDDQGNGLTTRSKIGASCKRWSCQSKRVHPRPTADCCFCP